MGADKVAGGGFFLRLFQCCRQTAEARKRLGICPVEIDVCCRRGHESAADAVEPGVDHQGKGKVAVCQRVGGAQFNAAIFPGGGRNADELGAVLGRPGNIGGSLLSNQTAL